MAAIYLIDNNFLPRHCMRAEIPKGSVTDITDRIGRCNRLEIIIIRSNLDQGEKIIIDILIDAVHFQSEGIALMKISTIVEEWLPDIPPIGKTVFKHKGIGHQFAIEIFDELVIISKAWRVLKIHYGIDVFLIVEIRV